MTVANITPTPVTDGVPYCTSVPLTFAEADLGDNVKTPAPIAVVEGQTIVAVVKLSVNGIVNNVNSYVVMQTFLGGVWVDVAWCILAGTNVVGTSTFILCGGGLGAMNNAFQQSRQAGGFPTPQANGSNALPLGELIRFVGKGVYALGSSSIAGTFAGVFATITYRLQQPR